MGSATDPLGILIVVLFGYVWPLAVGIDRGDRYRTKRGCKTQARYGAFGVLSGLIVAVVAPNYLDIQGWWAVYLLAIGGALFFSMGVGGLIASTLGEIGYGIAMPGFAAVMHYAHIAHRSTVGTNLTLKVGALLALGVGAVFLARGLVSPTPYRGSGRQLVSKRVAALIGAILELISFFNIIFGLWEKYVR